MESEVFSCPAIIVLMLTQWSMRPLYWLSFLTCWQVKGLLDLPNVLPDSRGFGGSFLEFPCIHLLFQVQFTVTPTEPQ